MKTDKACRISRVQVFLPLFFDLERGEPIFRSTGRKCFATSSCAFPTSQRSEVPTIHMTCSIISPRKPHDRKCEASGWHSFLDCWSFPYKNNPNRGLILALHVRSCVLAFLTPEFNCESVSTAITAGKELAAKSQSWWWSQLTQFQLGKVLLLPPHSWACVSTSLLPRLLWGWGNCIRLGFNSGWTSRRTRETEVSLNWWVGNILCQTSLHPGPAWKMFSTPLPLPSWASANLFLPLLSQDFSKIPLDKPCMVFVARTDWGNTNTMLDNICFRAYKCHLNLLSR